MPTHTVKTLFYTFVYLGAWLTSPNCICIEAMSREDAWRRAMENDLLRGAEGQWSWCGPGSETPQLYGRELRSGGAADWGRYGAQILHYTGELETVPGIGLKG